MTTSDWSMLNAFEGGQVWVGSDESDEQCLTEEQACALIARRDFVLVGLSTPQLLALSKPQCFDDRTLSAMVRRKLMHNRVGFRREEWRTDFGLELARVLDESEGT